VTISGTAEDTVTVTVETVETATAIVNGSANLLEGNTENEIGASRESVRGRWMCVANETSVSGPVLLGAAPIASELLGTTGPVRKGHPATIESVEGSGWNEASMPVALPVAAIVGGKM